MTNLWKTTEGKWTSTRFSTGNVEKSAINIRQFKVFHHLWKKKWWKTTMWKTEIVEKWKMLRRRTACCGNSVDKKT